MSNNKPEPVGPSGGEEKTISPDRTFIAKPDVGATIIGGETVDDMPAAESKPAAPDATIIGSTAAPSEVPGAHGTDVTFVSKPQKDESDQAHPTVDMDTPVPNETLIVEGDGVAAEQTIIGKLHTPDGREDLEDHFDTLNEDAQQPGTSPDSPGGFVIGDYQVLKELGRGGMGVVYKARHRKLNREVALKMILAGPHAGNEALERFITEARAVAHLQHPGIVQIFDIGEHEGLPFFSLEFVDGCDLQQKLKNTPQDPKESAALVEKLCHAMQYAHDNNILHRDIKPPNVLLDQNGEPKITDFGLAKEVDSEAASTGTQAGTIMGSPSYMPPEQARGEISSVTPRSDLYSLGAVLYEMLTGRPPFLAPRPLETVMQVVHNEPVPPRQLLSEIPVDLETICLKALQKDQSARYQNCQELAADLRRFINDEPILARPIGAAERLWKWCKRNPKIAFPSGLAMTAIIATAVIATWAWQATSAQAAVIAEERDNVKQQRDEAEKQKLIADENAEVAKKQALVALDSIQYVVSEIDGLLAEKPQLTDVRIELMKALSEKWDGIDLELAGGLQGEAIATQMAVRHKIAIAFSDMDQLKEADEEFEKLFQKGQERVDLKDRSDSARSNLVKIATAWSVVRKRHTNNPEDAVDLLRLAYKLSQETLQDPRPEEDSPPKIELLELHGAVCQNIGVELLRSGKLSTAAENFGEALSSTGEALSIIREEPGFTEKNDNQKDTLTANRQLGYDKAALALAYIQVRIGNTDESLELYKKAIEGRREIHVRRPKMAPLTEALAGFVGNYGNSLVWLGRLEEAEPQLEEALQVSKDLSEENPDIANFSRLHAISNYRLAVLRSLQDKEDDSTKLLKTCRKINVALVEKSPDRSNKIGLMLAEARLGNVNAAAALTEELSETDSKDPEIHLDVCRTHAQLSVHAKEDSEKQKHLSAALTSLERSVNDGYSDPFRLNVEPDLAPLHDELRFKAIIAKLQTSPEK